MNTLLKLSLVIPVIVIHKLEQAVPLAETLVAADFPLLEVTLRTPVALDAIEQIVSKVPQASVGAGTVIRSEQLISAQLAGAHFAVSPGLSTSLTQTARAHHIPYLPGIATPSEALAAYALGLNAVKFFPAERLGGVKTITAIAEVLPQLQFCSTGGINLSNLATYLASPYVTCVAGSWLVPVDLIAQQAWSSIRALAKQTNDILRQIPKSVS